MTTLRDCPEYVTSITDVKGLCLLCGFNEGAHRAMRERKNLIEGAQQVARNTNRSMREAWQLAAECAPAMACGLGVALRAGLKFPSSVDRYAKRFNWPWYKRLWAKIRGEW